jgi:phosphohistidine phosphatase SixA
LDTAVIFKKELGIKEKQFNVIDELLPGFDRKRLFAVISEKYNVESLMIVGHEPDLSMLISILLTGKGDAQIHLKKTGLCYLIVGNLIDDKCATLEWLIDPGTL